MIEETLFEMTISIILLEQSLSFVWNDLSDYSFEMTPFASLEIFWNDRKINV